MVEVVVMVEMVGEFLWLGDRAGQGGQSVWGI